MCGIVQEMNSLTAFHKERGDLEEIKSVEKVI